MTPPLERPGLLPEVRYTFTVRDQVAACRVCRVELREALSEPYHLVVELLCDDLELDPEDLLGADCCLAIARDDAPAREVLGLVLRVEQRGRRDARQALRLEIGPALALLAHHIDTRAWQGASVPDIVADVLEDRLAPLGRRLRRELDATYPAREYCVQYRESDLDFVRRLLHDEGIGFRFDHDTHADAETLVLFDDNSRCPARSPVPLLPRGAAVAAAESVERLERARQLGTTGVTQRDWVPLAAAEAPFTHTRCARDDRNRERIAYEHDDRRHDADDAGVRARRKLEQRTVLRDACRGAGDVVDFTAGLRFELTGHPDRARDRSYLLLRVEHHGEDADADRLGADISANAPRYTNSFVCIPDDVPFRPALDPHLRRPRVHGPHTAIVVGPEGEEIHTDEHGRIKLRFHWDRDVAADERASCWVRVAQTWAGAGWGGLFLPRVGMEVLVEFIDGDPDRPLVVGCVYNSLNTPPVALPNDKTCSALCSESSPGGGLANQIRLEDARGRESLSLKTRRDLHTSAGHDHTATVVANQITTIGGNQITTVQTHCALTVSDGDLTTTVLAGKQLADTHGDHTTVVRAGDHHVEAEQGSSVTRAKRAVTLQSLESELHLHARDDLYVVSEEHDILLSAGKTLRAGTRTAAIELEAATGIALTALAQDIAVSAQTDLKLATITGDITANAATDISLVAERDAHITSDTLHLTASQSLELRVGNAFIKISPGAITIGAPTISSTAVGEHTLSGALIRLN